MLLACHDSRHTSSASCDLLPHMHISVILPRRYVRSALGVHYAHTVVAGDAPNDLLALDAGGWHVRVPLPSSTHHAHQPALQLTPAVHVYTKSHGLPAAALEASSPVPRRINRFAPTEEFSAAAISVQTPAITWWHVHAGCGRGQCAA